MKLKEFVENHPAATSLALIVATVSSTTAVVDYLNHRNGAVIQALHETAMTELRTELGAEIADLQGRLTSIERGVGGTKSYFDITRISVTPENVAAMSAAHLPYHDGKFFVNAPSSQSWYYEETTESDMVYRRLGRSFVEHMIPPAVLKSMSASKVDLWRNSDVLKIAVPFRKTLAHVAEFEQLDITLAPSVFVQIVSEAQLSEMFREISVEMEAKLQDRENEMNRIGGLIETIEASARPGRGDGPGGTDASGTMDKAESKREMLVDLLNEVVISDATGFLLSQFLQSGFSFASIVEGGRYKVLSAQKKGNVFYLRSQLLFPGLIDGSAGMEHIVLDQEMFMIGTGREFVLVKVDVPSRHGRHNAFQWIAGWLTGLRVLLTT